MPGSPLKICAIPTSSDTARPPVRPHALKGTGYGVGGYRDGRPVLVEREAGANRPRGHVLAEDDGKEHHGDADDRRFLNVALAAPQHVEAYDQRERDGHED